MPRFAVHRDEATAAFFDGTARGEFLLVKDARTGDLLSPQFDVSADPDRYVHVPASGTGTVVSWSVVHERTPDGGTTRRQVGIVQLDEGPWWWTSFEGFPPDADLMDRRVKVAFEKLEDESVPYFTAL